MRGNRRSENNPEGAGSAAGDPTARIAPAEPQRSSQGLQFTGFTPIQPLPSIKEVTAQTQTIVQQVQTPQPPIVEMQNVATPQSAPAETVSQTVVEPQNVASPQPESVETASQPVVETQNVASQQPETVENVTTPVTETFEECWGKMVDVIFQKKPAFYHQLRDYLPRYENDIIYVDVENDFQKNQLEMSKRAMLEYWRNQFKLNVDDIEFIIHEHERKKVIYTSEDKVEYMLEQNPELKDFLQVLNFRIKD
jgi:DNA polymerase-3 subunit gamma/tau